MSQRPSTSKSRGVCKYFRSSRGCRNGDLCKFLHGDGETLSPYDKSKPCKFYSAGFCKHGDKCWFRHTDGTNDMTLSHTEPRETSDNVTASRTDCEDGEVLCSICQERPVTYGLLEDCSHVFCLECIRGWRDPNGKSQDIVDSGNTKRCPYCRTSSKFVIPSSVFYPGGNPLKEVTINKYKASMARIPCKYFVRSPPGARYCPFGKDCFYQHEELDGTPFVFDHGADYYLRRRRRLRNQAANVSFLNILSRIRAARRGNNVLQVLADLGSELDLEYPHIQEVTGEDDYYDPEDLGALLATHLGRTFNTLRMTSPFEDDGQEDSSGPSILATPDNSTANSALPLTRAFVDSNMPSEDDGYLADVHESENEEVLEEASSARTSFFRSQFRSYSLPNLVNPWTDDQDDRGDLVEDTSIYSSRGRTDGAGQAFLERLPRNTDDSQEESISTAVTSDEEPERANTLIDRESPTQRTNLNESFTTESLPNDAHPSSMDNRSTGGDNNLELRTKPEARNELTPRRTKSSNSSMPCGGRRNGGQTFVTDGRGRVVATDDWAYTDGASLAFWSSPTAVAPPSDSTDETSAPASVGLGALDDLD